MGHKTILPHTNMFNLGSLVFQQILDQEEWKLKVNLKTSRLMHCFIFVQNIMCYCFKPIWVERTI